MVSGLAPGNPADTWITGNSTCGSGATGRKLKASAPASSTAAASKEVPTGRLMNGAEAQQAGLEDCLFWRLVLHALRLERKVNHHDGVFLYDTDQQNDADQGHHSQVVACYQ